MNQDINIKKLQKNCWRQSKVPGEFMLQMRVPGSMISAKHLERVQYICQTWGNGNFHVGMRHTLNVPGVKYEDIPAVNDYISEYLEEVECDMCDVDMETDAGYPTIGSRNIMACIGNTHCILANYNTQDLARKLEPLVFPSHYHIKMSLSGCPNDCGKGHFNDFGIVGISKMVYHYERCIGCGMCIDACKKHATGVLSFTEDKKIAKDTCCCVGCGECATVCPAGAWTRRPTKFFRVLVGGRTGKQSPPYGQDLPQLGHRGRPPRGHRQLAEVFRLGAGPPARLYARRPPDRHGRLRQVQGDDARGRHAEPRGDGGAAHPVDRDRVPRPDQRDPAFRAPQGGPAKIMGRLPEKASRAYAREAFLAPVSPPEKVAQTSPRRSRKAPAGSGRGRSFGRM